jgi:hypothetical protein
MNPLISWAEKLNKKEKQNIKEMETERKKD